MKLLENLKEIISKPEILKDKLKTLEEHKNDDYRIQEFNEDELLILSVLLCLPEEQVKELSHLTRQVHWIEKVLRNQSLTYL
jgi:hypothetical protein